MAIGPWERRQQSPFALDDDPLTGLSGRSALERDLLAAAGHGRIKLRGVGVVLAGMDRLNLINYRLGYEGGDEVLRETAARLARAVAGSGQLYRLGGDEFAVLVAGLRHPGDLRAAATSMLRAARHPLATGSGDTVSTSISIGLASVGWDGADRDLLREADLALHRAKDTGRDRLVVFDETIRAEADTALDAERRLRRGLREDQLRLFLQPIVDLGTGEQVASEGLVRIVDARGVVSMPDSFIEVAEDRGLVSEIDRWCIVRAAELLRRDLTPAVAVNISARSFERLDVPGRVAAALEERQVDPGRFHLEVTETAIAATGTGVVQALAALRGFGCQVSIDDFGTGYSSLAHLATYPADTVKIDRSFVAGLGRGSREDAVVQAIVTLGHAHGLLVVAEGVERQEQARQLLQMGCDLAQGWYFGRPADPG